MEMDSEKGLVLFPPSKKIKSYFDFKTNEVMLGDLSAYLYLIDFYQEMSNPSFHREAIGQTSLLLGLAKNSGLLDFNRFQEESSLLLGNNQQMPENQLMDYSFLGTLGELDELILSRAAEYREFVKSFTNFTNQHITKDHPNYSNHPHREHEEAHKRFEGANPEIVEIRRWLDFNRGDMLQEFCLLNLQIKDNIYFNRIVHEWEAIRTELLSTSDNKIWILRSLELLSDFFIPDEHGNFLINQKLRNLVKLGDSIFHCFDEDLFYMIPELIMLYGEDVLEFDINKRQILNLEFLFGRNYLDENGQLKSRALFNAEKKIMEREMEVLRRGPQVKREKITQKVEEILRIRNSQNNSTLIENFTKAKERLQKKKPGEFPTFFYDFCLEFFKRNRFPSILTLKDN